MEGGRVECCCTAGLERFHDRADVGEGFLAEVGVLARDIHLRHMVLFGDKLDVFLSVGPFPGFGGQFALLLLLRAEGEFGGAEHGGLGEGGLQFQGLEVLALAYPVEICHHLAGLVVVEHAADGARGLRGGGESRYRAQQGGDEGLDGPGHGRRFMFRITWGRRGLLWGQDSGFKISS